MAKRTITTEWLANWRPTKRTEIGDRGAPGLRIRGGPSGAITFWIYDRVPEDATGILRRVGVNLGRWSEAGGQGTKTLLEAQQEVMARRQRKIEAPRRGDSVAVVCEAFKRDRLDKQERGNEAYAVILTHIVKAKPDPKRPPLGEWPAAKVTRADLSAVIRQAMERRVVEGRRLGGPGAARVVLRHVVSIFAHAVEVGLLEASVAAGMKLQTYGLKGDGRERYLSAAELELLFQALSVRALLEGTEEEERLQPATRLALAALLYTGVRTAALLNAKWSAVDLEAATWTIPVADQKLTREARKKAKPFVVPLCPTAIAIFKRLKQEAGSSPWVVTSPVELEDGQEPKRIDQKALIRALTRLQQSERLKLEPKVTVHDLRRTWRTWAGELGVSVDIAEKALGHVAANQSAGFSAAADIYDRSDKLDARREAMEVVGAAFDRVMQGAAARVVPLEERRSKRKRVGGKR